MLRQHGMRRRYYHDEVGWNTRLDGFQGAILQVKLKYIEGWNQAGARSQSAIVPCFTRKAWLNPEAGLAMASCCRRKFRALTTSGISIVIRTARRDALREFLASRKIGSEIYYPVPLHMQAALEDLGYHEGDFPEAERAAREVLALPIFPELREDEQQTVVDAVAGFLS